MKDDDIKIIREHIQSLPVVIQNAIKNSEVENLLRKLSEKHKLHLDLWQGLEYEVFTTLLGIEPTDTLRERLIDRIGIDKNIAKTLSHDISDMVFEPIRKEIERELESPLAEEKDTAPIEDLRMQVLENHKLGKSADAPIEKKKPYEIKKEMEEKPNVSIGNQSGYYKSGQTSVERRDVNNDPYRESIDL